MKRWPTLLLAVLPGLLAAEEGPGNAPAPAPNAIRLEIRSDNLSPSWFDDLSPNNRELVLKDGKVVLPECVAEPGKQAEIEVVAEKLVMMPGRAMPAPCGISVEVTPTRDEAGNIVLEGTVTLLRSGGPTAPGPPPGYERERTHFKTTVEPGKSRKIAVAGEGNTLQHLELRAIPVEEGAPDSE